MCWPRACLSLPNFGNTSSFNAVVQLLRFSVSLAGRLPVQPYVGSAVEKTFHGLVGATDRASFHPLARLFYRQLASEHWQYFVSSREQDPWSLMCVLLAPLSLLPAAVRDLFRFHTAVTFSCNTCSALSTCTEAGAIVCMLARECGTLAATNTDGTRFSRVIKNVRRPCELCGRQYAQISLQLLDHPPLLVVCFRAGKYHRGRGLSSTERDYQDVQLDAELPFDGGVYRLAGVITRFRPAADALSGYLCYQRHADSWLEFSDNTITPVSWQHVRQQQTYIHVYQRIYRGTADDSMTAAVKKEEEDAPSAGLTEDSASEPTDVLMAGGAMENTDALSVTNQGTGSGEEPFCLQDKKVVHIRTIEHSAEGSVFAQHRLVKRDSTLSSGDEYSLSDCLPPAPARHHSNYYSI